MKKVAACFYSDGYKLDAEYYLPDNIDEKKPMVLANSGFLGLRNIHPERFARFLTKQGYPCFGFDYRGFSRSEGDVSQVRWEQQVDDIAHAAAFVKSHPDFTNRKLVLLGWGMGAALVLHSTRIIPEVNGLICVNGFYNNRRVQQKLRGPQGWEKFQEWFSCEQRNYVKGSNSKLYDPFEIYPLDAVTKTYVDNVLFKNPDFGAKVKFGFAESLLSLAIQCDDSLYENIPLFVVHGEKNQLHPASEATWLMDNYRGKNKQQYWVEGGGHTEYMLDDNPKCIAMMEQITNWLNQNA